jgi:hypothetical protein
MGWLDVLDVLRSLDKVEAGADSGDPCRWRRREAGLGGRSFCFLEIPRYRAPLPRVAPAPRINQQLFGRECIPARTPHKGPCHSQSRLWRNHMGNSTDEIALGITDDHIALGSRLIHFWQNEEEFERGVRFLELGIANESEYCVLFGHDEANDRVLKLLRKTCGGLDRVLQEGRLVILRREVSASETLAIEAAFAAAVSKGATAIRYLGNLGMGQAPLPGKGADEVVELENGATLLYDVNTVSGRLVLNAGFGTHPLAVRGHALRRNAYFAPHEETARTYRAAR